MQCGQIHFKTPLFFTKNFQSCGGSVFTQLIYCFECSNCMFKRRKLLHFYLLCKKACEQTGWVWLFSLSTTMFPCWPGFSELLVLTDGNFSPCYPNPLVIKSTSSLVSRLYFKRQTGRRRQRRSHQNACCSSQCLFWLLEWDRPSLSVSGKRMGKGKKWKGCQLLVFWVVRWFWKCFIHLGVGGKNWKSLLQQNVP